MADRAPPSTTAVAIAVSIISGTIGYFLGQGSSIGLFGTYGNPSGPHGQKQKKSWPNSYDVDVHVDSSDEELIAATRAQPDEDSDSDREVLGELNPFEGSREEVKLVMAVRTDLGMGKGIYRSLMLLLRLFANFSVQVKLPPSVPTLRSPATNPWLTTPLLRLFYAAGSRVDNRRLLYRPSRKTSSRCCRRRP